MAIYPYIYVCLCFQNNNNIRNNNNILLVVHPLFFDGSLLLLNWLTNYFKNQIKKKKKTKTKCDVKIVLSFWKTTVHCAFIVINVVTFILKIFTYIWLVVSVYKCCHFMFIYAPWSMIKQLIHWIIIIIKMNCKYSSTMYCSRY